MYTDGSVIDKESNTGAGIICKLFTFHILLGTNTMENKAINASLKQLFSHTQSFIPSDTKAAIQTIIEHMPPNTKTTKIHHPIKLQGLHKEIVLQWTTSHSE
jgi:ribonuclease HI